MPDNIASTQAPLVLKAFGLMFQNQLISSETVTWNKSAGELDDTNALSINEQISPRYEVYETIQGVQDVSAGAQDSVFGSENYTINRTFGCSMGFGDFNAIRDINDARRSESLKAMALNLAEKVDSHILGLAATAANNWTGNAGDVLGTANSVANGITRLAEEGAPMDDLNGLGNFSDRQLLGKELYNLPSARGLAEESYRKGFGGEIQGLPMSFTQQLAFQTNGSRTNGAVNGANQFTDYSAVSSSTKNGYYLTQDFLMKGLGAGATVKKGEVFTITGVNAFDNRKQGSLGRSQQFTVVEDVTADGAGLATVKIFPAIVVKGSLKVSTNSQNANNANATVDSIPADSAVITWKGSASTTYTPRLVMHKSAIRVMTKDLMMPYTGEASRVALTKVPASVRMWKYSNGDKGVHRIRFDIALTANISRRRFISRVNGE